MADSSRKRTYDARSFEAEVGGHEIHVAPLRGVQSLRAFEDALMEEILGFRDVYEERLRNGEKASPETLLLKGVDVPRLLKLGLPDVLTDELLEQTTIQERVGLLTDLLYLNNLGRFAPFVSPELILELSMRLSREAPGFPMPEPSSSSSEPVLAGEPSSTS